MRSCDTEKVRDSLNRIRVVWYEHTPIIEYAKLCVACREVGATRYEKYFVLAIINIGHSNWIACRIVIDISTQLAVDSCSHRIHLVTIIDQKGMRVSALNGLELNRGTSSLLHPIGERD